MRRKIYYYKDIISMCVWGWYTYRNDGYDSIQLLLLHKEDDFIRIIMVVGVVLRCILVKNSNLFTHGRKALQGYAIVYVYIP